MNEHMTKISVITPVFKGRAHIESCLNTVLDQNCKHAEHIIIDGNSNDGTIEVVKNYAAQYPHIRWISEPDHGQSDAMNKGISLARGMILSILNVDDYFEPNVLNKIVNLFDNLPEHCLLVGNCNVRDSKGNLRYVNKPGKLTTKDLLLGWEINPHPVNPSAYFYHKSIHDVIGGYDRDNHFAMDLDFILKASRIANFQYIDEIWGNFCELDGSKTVIDRKRGEGQKRYKMLLREHRRKLSPVVQCQILGLRFVNVCRKVLRKFFQKLRRKFVFIQPKLH